MNGARIVRAALHPLRSARRLVQLVAAHPSMPWGRTAEVRRLLREGLSGPGRLLVIGPADVVAQALPGTALDVVGTGPRDPRVTVVSEAQGRGSLPRRWDRVVLTRPDPPRESLLAAAAACRPGGVVAVFSAEKFPTAQLPGAAIEVAARSRHLRLVQMRPVE